MNGNKRHPREFDTDSSVDSIFKIGLLNISNYPLIYVFDYSIYNNHDGNHTVIINKVCIAYLHQYTIDGFSFG